MCCSYLRQCCVFILSVAANSVGSRHIFRCHQHRHVGMLGVGNDVWIFLIARPFQIGILQGGNIFLPTGYGNVLTIHNDLLCSRRNSHQPGGALPVDRLSCCRIGKASSKRRQPGDIHACCPRRKNRSDDDIFDRTGVHACMFNRMLNGVPHQGWGFNVVQRTLEGNPNRGSCC